MAGEDHHYANLCERITLQLSYNFEYNARSEEIEFLPAVAAKKEKHLYPRPIHKLDLLPLCEGKLFSQGVFLDTDRTAPKSIRMQSAYLSFCEYEKLFEEVQGKPILSANPLKDYSQPIPPNGVTVSAVSYLQQDRNASLCRHPAGSVSGCCKAKADEGSFPSENPGDWNQNIAFVYA